MWTTKRKLRTQLQDAIKRGGEYETRFHALQTEYARLAGKMSRVRTPIQSVQAFADEVKRELDGKYDGCIQLLQDLQRTTSIRIETIRTTLEPKRKPKAKKAKIEPVTAEND